MVLQFPDRCFEMGRRLGKVERTLENILAYPTSDLQASSASDYLYLTNRGSASDGHAISAAFLHPRHSDAPTSNEERPEGPEDHRTTDVAQWSAQNCQLPLSQLPDESNANAIPAHPERGGIPITQRPLGSNRQLAPTPVAQ